MPTMTEKLDKLVRFWPIMAAIIAISVSWGTAEMRIATANDGVRENRQTIENIQGEVNGLATSAARMEANQHNIRRQLDRMQRMLERSLNRAQPEEEGE